MSFQNLKNDLSVFTGHCSTFSIDCPQAVRKIPFVVEILGSF
jgi:hypothetical protein